MYGVLLTKKYLNYMKKKYDNFYILKLDISKYFYSMDHEVLKGILKRKIKDKKALNVLFKMIDSTDRDYINKEIIKLKKRRIYYLKNSNLNNKYELIKEVMEIPLYEKGKGVNIGAQVSQAFGLIYLYEIIHFIKEELKIKCLVNYMDDIICIHEDKDYLKYCLKNINEKIEKYKLRLNPKKLG